MFVIEISQYAENDIIEAYNWYQDITDGLGKEFLDKVDQCLSAISGNPEHFQLIEFHIRRSIFQKFPYAVFFEIWNNKVYVLGVIHTSRTPGIYRNR